MGKQEQISPPDPDKDIEAWFESRAWEQPVQQRFFPQPTFLAKDLTEGAPPGMSFTSESVTEVPTPGTRLTVSELEIVYPWLLAKTGMVAGTISERPESAENLRASVFGSKLHMADVLFSIIVQGVRGEKIWELMPTAKREEVERFDNASYFTPAGRFGSEEELYEMLWHAWSDFHRVRGFYPDEFDVPLPGFGMRDPNEERALFYGDEVFDIGLKLARAWATEVFRDPPMSWEFDPACLRQSEVTVAMKFNESNLQFVGRLDSITRKISDKHKQQVRSQIIDLKTGKPHPAGHHTLEREVNIRQQQLLLVLAERFTSRYLVKLKSMTPLPRNKIFTSRADARSTAHIDRLDLAGYRRFNMDTGEMTLEPFSMNDDERREFNDWLTWLGETVAKYKQDIRRLLDRKPRYDLRGFELPDKRF